MHIHTLSGLEADCLARHEALTQLLFQIRAQQARSGVTPGLENDLAVLERAVQRRLKDAEHGLAGIHLRYVARAGRLWRLAESDTLPAAANG